MPIILGGGISGLTAAYFLSKNAIKPITLFEASGRIGGWLQTETHSDRNYFFEMGPRTIRPFGPRGRLTLKLLEDLNLSHSIRPINSNHPAAKNRMLYVDNKLCPLPSSVSGLFKTLPPFSKPLIAAVVHDLKTRRTDRPLSDESIYDFTRRRFGDEIARYAISSMICGICAGDAKEISVKLLMDEVFRKEQKFGGVIKGMILSAFENSSLNKDDPNMFDGNLSKRCTTEKWRIYSLDGGIEILPKTLENYLIEQNVSIMIDSKCEEIRFDPNRQRAIIRINDGSEYITDQLISSLPSYVLASLLHQHHPDVANELKQIPYVDVAVVNLQYNAADLVKTPGFGVLVPPIERLPILGIIFDSCCFDMQQNTVLTVMMGGKWFPENFGPNPSEDQLLDVAIENVRKILNISDRPEHTKVNILRKCIPQYVVGHSERVNRIRAMISGNRWPIQICGAPYDGIGVNDVIYSGWKAATSLNK